MWSRAVYLIFFSFFISNFFHGQELLVPNNFSMVAPKYSSKFLSKSNLNVYYDVAFLRNSQASKITSDLCILQIGNNYSKFIDNNSLKKDSLFNLYSTKKSIGGTDIGNLLKFKQLWKRIVIKEYDHKNITIQNEVKLRYQYEEPFFDFKWKLSNESKEILGFNCKKATTHFRGRNYTAFYTENIPIIDGPDIFSGLPGLILEVYDDQNNFHFTAKAVSKTPMEIYIRNEDDILFVNREKFLQIEKSYYDNPSFFHGRAYNEDGSLLENKRVKSIPYNRMELE